MTKLSPNPSDRIVLVDSSSFLHANFHGYPPRPVVWGSRGHTLDVAAVYGYLEFVRSVDRHLEFERLIHVIDPNDGCQHRLRIYPEYKATRKASDPVLSAQKVLLPQVLSIFGQRVVRQPGVESDDLIGSLAHRYANEGCQVLVLTADKDLMQLVRDGEISMGRRVNRADGVHGKIYDFYEEKDVEAKMGVRPDQVADLLALAGDSVDNIPGVPRVGPTTAARWLQKYDTLDEIMAASGEIKGKVGDALRDALPMLPLYRQLTQVRCGLEVDLCLERPLVERQRLDEMRQRLGIPDSWDDRLCNERADDMASGVNDWMSTASHTVPTPGGPRPGRAPP